MGQAPLDRKCTEYSVSKNLYLATLLTLEVLETLNLLKSFKIKKSAEISEICGRNFLTLDGKPFILFLKKKSSIVKG
jgi:hypothetical protein